MPFEPTDDIQFTCKPFAALPRQCCMNVARGGPFKSCNKRASHWYEHNADTCSYCDEHDYVCGAAITPVYMTPAQAQAVLEGAGLICKLAREYYAGKPMTKEFTTLMGGTRQEQGQDKEERTWGAFILQRDGTLWNCWIDSARTQYPSLEEAVTHVINVRGKGGTS